VGFPLLHTVINMNTFASQIMRFYTSLKPEFPLPDGVQLLNPFTERMTQQLANQFYERYFNDNKPRKFVFGINPGRLGGGVTGIPFTDPVRLHQNCGIDHHLPMKQELSSDFIYRMIENAGGPQLFYSECFLTAVCPLGFTHNGKNLNYYDTVELFTAARPFIMSTIKKQVKAGCFTKTAWCLGEGTNYKYFNLLNDELKIFKEIIALPHPRWIMQYQRKSLDHYIELYKDKLNVAV